MIRRIFLFLIAVGAVVSLGTISSQAQSMLTRHVREVVSNGEAKPIGRLPSDQIMQLDVVLPLRDQAGLELFLADLYNPSSSSYRQFLTPAQFTERFGPSQEDYDAVVHFARANGFTIVGGTRDGMEVQIKGTVAAIQTAFHVTMRTYQHPTEDRIFHAPDSEPTTNLPFRLWHVSGLDDYSIPQTRLVKKTDYAKAHGIAPEDVVTHATTGSGPSASFLGSDMRAAYYGGTALTGAGQNLGLFEYEGTDLADLQTYYTNAKQTYPTGVVSLLSVDGTSTACLDTRAGGDCDDTEQTLDMTQALGMAPGLSSLVVYIGSTDTAIISAMTTHSPLPTTVGCSWGWTPADASTLDPYFEKMASQGQNFFAASGDDSTWASGTGANAPWPADDAHIVSVGGTDLVTASAAGPWQSETAWVDSGGGIAPSADGVAIPTWQQLSGVINSSNKGSTTYRNGPDVSANANFTFYTCADQKACQANAYGGTSFAAPMWAGYIALVNQQLVANGQSTIGFLNPTIYAQNVVPATYAADFHDITSGTSGSYSAVTGYDLVTGWGSPTAALINALAPTAKTSQTITFPNPGPLSYPNSPNTVTLTATATSGLAVTYAVTSGPGTISGSVLTVTGTGTIVVTASQAGNSTYAAATPVADSIVVNAAAAASISSPASGGTLTAASTTFTWSANGSTTPVYLWVGSTAGGNDLVNVGPLSGTSTTVTLPTAGAKVYVTLWSTLSGSLVSTTATYTEALLAATIQTPTSGSTLTAAATTITWSANGSTTPAYLWIGSTSGGNDLVNVGPLSGTSTTVTLPTSGNKVYATLWSTLNGNLVSTTTTYTEATLTGASIQTPSNGGVLSAAATTITWSANGSTTPAYLWIGSTSGGNDLVNVGPLSGTSTTVTLPTAGNKVYATLWSTLNGNLVSTTATYTEATLTGASIQTPSNGSVLTGATTTITWTSNGSTTPVYLWIGSVSGGNDLVNIGPLPGTSTTVTLPTAGAPVYVTLWSTLNGTLVSTAMTYTEASVLPATIVSPSNGSTVSGQTTFTWVANQSTAPVYIWVGSTPGGLDVVNAGPFSGTTATVTLPTNGNPVYVTLWSTVNGNLVSSTVGYNGATSSDTSKVGAKPAVVIKRK